MKKITKTDLLKKLQDTKETFTVTFIKKDGTERVMKARLDEKKHENALAYNPKEKALLSVFDIQINEYRMVNIKTVMSAKVDNEEYKVIEG
jgi:vacuolar-type H+-ATPase subunit C/Vma6